MHEELGVPAGGNGGARGQCSSGGCVAGHDAATVALGRQGRPSLCRHHEHYHLKGENNNIFETDYH